MALVQLHDPSACVTDSDPLDFASLAIGVIQSGLNLSRTPPDDRSRELQALTIGELNVIIDSVNEEIEDYDIESQADLAVLREILRVYAASVHTRFKLLENLIDLDRSIYILEILPQLCDPTDRETLSCLSTCLEGSLRLRRPYSLPESIRGGVIQVPQNFVDLPASFTTVVKETLEAAVEQLRIPVELRDSRRIAHITTKLTEIISTFEVSLRGIKHDLSDSYQLSLSRYSLATALRLRFQLLGDIRDVNRAIAELASAYQRCSSENHHVLLSISLGLIASLDLQYRRTNDPKDLDRLIEVEERTLAQSWCTKPTLMSLTLGQHLLQRMAIRHDLGDGSRALRLSEDILRDVGEEGRSDCLFLRARAATELARVDKDAVSFDRCVEVLREARDVCDAASLDERFPILNLTASFLTYRFCTAATLEGDMELVAKIAQEMKFQGIEEDWDPWNKAMFVLESDKSLDDTIEGLRRVCRSCSPNDTHLSILTLVLASALQERYHRTHQPEDLQEAITFRSSLVDSTPSFVDAFLLAQSSINFGFNENAKVFMNVMKALTAESYASPSNGLGKNSRGIPHSFGDAVEHLWREGQKDFTPEADRNLQTFLLSGKDVDFLRSREANLLGLSRKHITKAESREHWRSLAQLHQHRWELHKDMKDLEEAVNNHRAIVDSLSSEDQSWEANVYRFVYGMALFELYHESPSMMDRAELLSAQTNIYEAANAKDHTILLRVAAVKLWFSNLPLVWEENKVIALNMCDLLLSLLEQLGVMAASPRASLDARYEIQPVLVHAATLALIADPAHIRRVVEILEAGRSLVWSQATKLRAPLLVLSTNHQNLASRFQQLSQTLEEYSGLSDRATQSMPLGTNHWRLQKDRDEVLKEIQALPGFEDFLKPKSFDELSTVTNGGPVIVLLPHTIRCLAIVLLQGHCTLCKLPITLANIKELHQTLRVLAGARGEGVGEGNYDTDLRSLRRKTPNKSVDDVLRVLWSQVAKPVIDLVMDNVSTRPKKTGSPVRFIRRIQMMTLLSNQYMQKLNDRDHIWWCCMGEFSFMPIHAAGIYQGPSPICVSDFFVSSYTPTLTALLEARKRRDPTDIKVLAAIQPEPGRGWSNLRHTKDELKEVVRAVPQEYLVSLNESSQPDLEGTHTTVQNIIKKLLDATILHLGCHGIQDARDPLKSAFILANAERLTIEELMKHPLRNAYMAILTACYTASNDTGQPDDSLNLANAMLFLGFRSILATMW